MRFHSKNRSQSAVSEPTRLSVPFEAMSSALIPEQRRNLLLVVGQVLVEGRARGHAGLLELDHHQRQAVDEADQIRPAGVERAGDAELADQQEIIVRPDAPNPSPAAARSSGRRASRSGTDTVMPSLSSR